GRGRPGADARRRRSRATAPARDDPRGQRDPPLAEGRRRARHRPTRRRGGQRGRRGRGTGRPAGGPRACLRPLLARPWRARWRDRARPRHRPLDRRASRRQHLGRRRAGRRRPLRGQDPHSPSPGGHRVKRSPLLVGLVAIIAVAAAGGIYGFATLFLHPAPSAVALDPSSSQSAASIGSLPSGATSTLAAGIDGTWAVDTSIGSFSDFSGSWVGYRVDETLAGNRANTAVGRTPDVTGTLTMSGTQITAVQVNADLTSLKSDDNR